MKRLAIPCDLYWQLKNHESHTGYQLLFEPNIGTTYQLKRNGSRKYRNEEE